MLTDEPLGWEGTHWPTTLHHRGAGLTVRVMERGTKGLETEVWVGDPEPNYAPHIITSLFTPDDLVRIRDQFQKLHGERLELEQRTALSESLARLSPNPFDSTARELARCVLRGDGTAARPLVDRAIECLSESG